MASDLSDLDVTAPAEGDAASAGDDEIRTTRLYIRNWADVEHQRTGQHKFPAGAQAAKPAAGYAARLFLDTTLGRFERDDGTEWLQAHAIQLGSANTAGSITLTTNYQTIQTVTMTLAKDARMILVGSAQLVSATASVIDLYLKLRVGSTDIDPEIIHAVHTYAQKFTAFAVGIYDGLAAAGSTSMTLQAKVSSAAASNVLTERNLWVLAG